jgi:hypothetical protein
MTLVDLILQPQLLSYQIEPHGVVVTTVYSYWESLEDPD